MTRAIRRALASSFAASIAALTAPSLVPGDLAAQARARRTAWELRADGFAAADERAAHVGAGLGFPLGTYARAVVAAGMGTALVNGGDRLSARAEALLRLTTDPFAEQRRALTVAAGLSTRTGPPDGPRTALVLLVGVDGRARGGWAPGAELGLGGGVRAGVALRQVRGGRR